MLSAWLRPITECVGDTPFSGAKPDMDSRHSTYRNADNAISIDRGVSLPVDPSAYERGLISHRTLQNQLAELLARAGFEPRSPGKSGPDFDLGFAGPGGIFYIVEVKSSTEENDESQLRLGLGQVLRYCQKFGREALPVLLIEREPADPTWYDLCASHGVELISGRSAESWISTLAANA